MKRGIRKKLDRLPSRIIRFYSDVRESVYDLIITKNNEGLWDFRYEGAFKDLTSHIDKTECKFKGSFDECVNQTYGWIKQHREEFKELFLDDGENY